MGYIFYLIAIIIVAVALQPKSPEVTPPNLDQLKAPTAKQGTPVPKAFGRVIVQSPNIVWYGDLAYNDIRVRVR